MQIKEYSEFLGSMNKDMDCISTAISNVSDFESFLLKSSGNIDAVSVESVKRYFGMLIAEERNSLQLLVDIARYLYLTKQNEAYIYVLSTVNGREVLESISEKVSDIAGTDSRNAVFEGLNPPPLGAPPESYPENTCRIVERLSELGTEICRDILADNHHGIPRESFTRQKEWLEESDSIDEFLEKLHTERIRILQQHLDAGKVWFEQEITPEIIDLVKGNQEILSAVREGEYLYITKIPYSPGKWSSAQDDRMKRYYACHCPLAREAIVMEGVDIPRDWCYCSGGFTKYMFDVLFDEPTEVELLESVLSGDTSCRFRIRLPERFIPQ
jgi:hypothetical protein